MNVHVHVLVQRGFMWLLTSVPKLVLGVEEGVGETFAGEGGNLPQGGEKGGRSVWLILSPPYSRHPISPNSSPLPSDMLVCGAAWGGDVTLIVSRLCSPCPCCSHDLLALVACTRASRAPYFPSSKQAAQEEKDRAERKAAKHEGEDSSGSSGSESESEDERLGDEYATLDSYFQSYSHYGIHQEMLKVSRRLVALHE